ncbi:MAG: 50S ribosomal protein L11 methyltransferase [Lachnospiraceae bacterium]|nr:50S ribosomal protein L11 methyltransferase [Lachnospiraceae bacterium]
MEWMKYTINTTEEAEDLVCSMLNDFGIMNVEIEDKAPVSPGENGGYFGDVVPDLGFDDHTAKVSFYQEIPEDDPEFDEDEILRKVGRGLLDLQNMGVKIGSAQIDISTTAQEDWANNWKQYFHQFMVDDILIIPSWEDVEPEQEASMVLRIDPGIAFGTGKHESTQLAIRGLRKYLKDGMRVLDIGTGSGILGIVALKSGAGYVLGTDLDVNTLEAIGENIEKNGVDPESFAYVIGNIQDDPAIQEYAGGDYDIVVANIIAEILAGITPVVPNHLKKGGIYITSGILITHAQVVRDAMAAAGFTIIEENEMGEWESIVARLD